MANLTAQEQQELTALELKANTVTLSAGSGRAQAERAIAMLEASPNRTVTAVQLQTINAKYPSDPIYYARKLFGCNISTLRGKNGTSRYVMNVTTTEQKRLIELRAKAAQAAENKPVPATK